MENTTNSKTGLGLTLAIMGAVLMLFVLRLALRSIANVLKLSAWVLSQPSKGLSWAAKGADGLGRVSERLTARLSAKRAGETLDGYYLRMAAEAAAAAQKRAIADAAKAEKKATVLAAKEAVKAAKAAAKAAATPDAAPEVAPAPAGN